MSYIGYTTTTVCHRLICHIFEGLLYGRAKLTIIYLPLTHGIIDEEQYNKKDYIYFRTLSFTCSRPMIFRIALQE